MGTEISWEIREKAEELYIVDGMTFEQVAEETGVSVAQLKRWGAAGVDLEEKPTPSWTDRRREYRSAISNIRRDTVLLRKRLIAKALNSLNPQDVFAISSLESTAAKLASRQDAAPTKEAAPVRIATPADAVAALQQAVESKLGGMLEHGTVSFSGIKDMKQSLELLEKMREKYAADEPEAAGENSEEDRQRLVAEVDRILGVR